MGVLTDRSAYTATLTPHPRHTARPALPRTPSAHLRSGPTLWLPAISLQRGQKKRHRDCVVSQAQLLYSTPLPTPHRLPPETPAQESAAAAARPPDPSLAPLPPRAHQQPQHRPWLVQASPCLQYFQHIAGTRAGAAAPPWRLVSPCHVPRPRHSTAWHVPLPLQFAGHSYSQRGTARAPEWSLSPRTPHGDPLGSHSHLAASRCRLATATRCHVRSATPRLPQVPPQRAGTGRVSLRDHKPTTTSLVGVHFLLG